MLQNVVTLCSVALAFVLCEGALRNVLESEAKLKTSIIDSD